MKYYIMLFLSFLIISCNDNDEELRCSADSLFEMENVSGEMMYLMCYDAWAIKLDEPNDAGDTVLGASYDIPEEFKQEGLKVSTSACFHTFDMELLFPDPVIWGEMYVIKNFQFSEE